MKEQEKERVNQAFEHGTRDFSQKDLEKVMADAEVAEEKGGKLGDQIENFKVLWSLLKDYYNGTYRNVPWKFIAAIGFAVAYLISPIDVIPDFIPLVGFVDDAAVFGLVVKSFMSEIEEYKTWKKNN
ncbi:MAG: DUF1232 domain-containing protein [Lentisphaerae bacterium]|nr:DUF1232 domain-containing protein [Lentisphaerota bacterium]